MKIPPTPTTVSSDTFKCEDLVGLIVGKEKLLCLRGIMLYHISH